MPIEAKPLFRPDVISAQARGFCTARTRRRLPAQAGALGRAYSCRAGRLVQGTGDPSRLLDRFLLRGLLGYTRPADGGERYTISRERLVEVNGKFADAVLGDFRDGKAQFVVALEGKGPKDPLDRPYAGRRVSAVDQGYHYAINLPCDWIIVTSIRQTRLYYKGADQYTYDASTAKSLPTAMPHWRGLCSSSARGWR